MTRAEYLDSLRDADPAAMTPEQIEQMRVYFRDNSTVGPEELRRRFDALMTRIREKESDRQQEQTEDSIAAADPIFAQILRRLRRTLNGTKRRFKG